MNDDMESYLRTALGHAAERAPKAPPRFPAKVVSRSNRRRTARNTLVAGICVTAIAIPISLVAAHGTERGGVTSGTIAASASSTKDYTGDEFRIGAVLLIDNPSENRPISLWYARTDNGTALCARVRNRTGSGSAQCRQPLGAEEVTEQGSTGGPSSARPPGC